MTSTPRQQCRHIFTDGHRCGSPCLRLEPFCYYHHTHRKPIHNLTARKSRRAITLPTPEDRSAIQHSIGEVLQRIAANQLDPRRAGLLLYGLQIAAMNLPKPNPKAQPIDPVDDITLDPDHGFIAIPQEHGTDTLGPGMRRLEELVNTCYRRKQQLAEAEASDNDLGTIPSLDAAADPEPTAAVVSATLPPATDVPPAHPKSSPNPKCAKTLPQKHREGGGGTFPSRHAHPKQRRKLLLVVVLGRRRHSLLQRRQSWPGQKERAYKATLLS